MSLLKPSQKEGAIYQNPVPTEQLTGGFFKMFRKYLNNKKEVVPRIKPGPFYTDTSVYNTPPASGLRITWIGHSSLLVEIDGYRILTDPVWAQRASFVTFAGPKRFFDAPLALEELPLLDAIIFSHDHYDHFDKEAVQTLASITSCPVLCSLGVDKYLKQWGIAPSRIQPMDWMDNTTIGKLTVTALPARHFSGRGITNRNHTLWSSFVIRGPNLNIYFGADSGYYHGFKEIGDAYGPFDLTMLEIGAYDENWAHIHMGPANAAQAHIDLKGKVMMPIHWGTFNLALHQWQEPIIWLQQEAKEKGITLFAPTPGIPTEVDSCEHISHWWNQAT